jgi:EmrB/QacA subfamily drug resistance transporter
MSQSSAAAARADQPRAHAPDWMVLSLVCLAQFMVILDISVVNVALPSIRRDLIFTQTGLQWVVNAYTLAFAGFLLLGGRAADLYGRRRVFILGLGLFTLASLAGGLAQDRAMLVGARAVQGLGAAVLAPATLTILTTHFREAKARARALGVWSAVAAGGGAAGALLGGILTDLLSWRWILYINIPIGVVGLIGARLILVESFDRERHRSLDLPGAATVTAGLVALVYAIVESTSRGWGSFATILTLVIAAVLLGTFVLIEARLAKAPLMPLAVFRSRSLTGANLVIFFLAAAMFAMWFFLSLYMQNVLGYSPLKAGFAFLPQTIAIAVGAQISSRLVTRIGARPLLIFAGLLSAAGMAWLSRITPAGGYFAHIFGPSALVTFGLGLAFTPVTFAATAGVPMEQAGLASGLINTTRQVGGSIGLAALATIAAERTIAFMAGGAGAPGAAALTAGYARAFAVSVWFLLGAAASATIIPAITPRREVARRRAAEPAMAQAAAPILDPAEPARGEPG